MEEITTRTLDAQGMTPVRAYAALRAKAPARSSFLLEMTEPDERGEQLSTIGFLAKSEAAHPAAVDATRDFAAAAVTLPPASTRPEVAAACCTDRLALLMFDTVLPANGLAPWPDQSYVGRELRDVASVVFDHVAGTFTIAATNANVIERCARVIAAAPELPELPAAAGALPLYLSEQPPAPAFAKLLKRAQRRLAMGGLDRVLLNRGFAGPPRGADLFEVFRALRALAPRRHHFFFELGSSPMFPGLTLAGTARTATRLTTSGDADALAKEMLALFPVEASCGGATKEVLAAWREIGGGPLAHRGSLVARARPGGIVDVLHTDAFVVLEGDQLHTLGIAEVTAESTPATHTAAIERDVADALAAIRLAQDAAEAREAATPAAEPEPAVG